MTFIANSVNTGKHQNFHSVLVEIKNHIANLKHVLEVSKMVKHIFE